MREPRIVNDGWAEVVGSLAGTGFFKEDQLNPEVALRILADIVRRYTTVIGYGEDGRLSPIGSGTFLRRTNGQPGILTAGHVVGAVKNREDILVLPAQDREDVIWVPIEGTGMHGHGEANRGGQGPDIGWIPLSGEEVERLEARGAVFRNRAREQEAFTGEMCQISIIFGFVNAASDLDDKVVVAHGMLMGQTGAEAPDDQGWDYGEYAITSDDPWIPHTHGGVSGSAVWRIDLPMDGLGRRAILLEGVVYAEGREEDRKLIAHGKQSLRIFLGEG